MVTKNGASRSWRYKSVGAGYYMDEDTYADPDYDDSGWALLPAPIATAKYDDTTPWPEFYGWWDEEWRVPRSTIDPGSFWVRAHFSGSEIKASAAAEAIVSNPKYAYLYDNVIKFVVHGTMTAFWNGEVVSGIPSGGSFTTIASMEDVQKDNVLAIHMGRNPSTANPLPNGDPRWGQFIDAYPLTGGVGWKVGGV